MIEKEIQQENGPGGDELTAIESKEESSGVEAEQNFSKGKIAFLFFIGFLIGVSIKAQAVKSVTMGYDDYKLKSLVGDYNLSSQQDVTASSEDQSQENTGNVQGQTDGQQDQADQVQAGQDGN